MCVTLCGIWLLKIKRQNFCGLTDVNLDSVQLLRCSELFETPQEKGAVRGKWGDGVGGGGGGAESGVRVGVDMFVCVTDLLIMINMSSVLLKLGWGWGAWNHRCQKINVAAIRELS